ncbi:MAG: glycine zipper 2TM domain-containing protein [Pseudomonadales bacterium]|nr:glycine zipper 2TM domain-containing protein [Pseudomonadales bacterium]
MSKSLAKSGVPAIAAAVLMAVGGSAALADNGRYVVPGRYDTVVNEANRYDPGRPDSARYDGYDYARVLDVDPIRTRVRVRTPQRECWQETHYDGGYRGGSYDSQYRAGRPMPSAGSMILGGIIGAAVGNQIGSGDGRRAATVAGAIIGSAVGHDAAARRDTQRSYNRDAYYDDRGREYSVERCETRYRNDWEERIDGYRVTYEYNGVRQTTRLPYDPGERLRVRVDVRPAR